MSTLSDKQCNELAKWRSKHASIEPPAREDHNHILEEAARPEHIYLCECDWLFQEKMAHVIDYHWAEVHINNRRIPIVTTRIYGASDPNVKLE